MKQILMLSLFFCGLWPLSSIAQIGVADPVTGNAAINFWGKVVDQDNNPLPGAQITLALDYGSSKGVMERKAVSLEADQNGDFALKNEQGHGFDVKAIDKAGYQLSKKVKLSYSYSWSGDIFHPDSNAPVIFKMWKKNGAEPLVGSIWKGNISCDGTTNRFDLSRGHRNPDGGLEIACTRNPLQSPPPGNGPFDYVFYIAVVDGGIQPTGDEFTYLAPENGYTINFTETKKAGEPGWRGKLQQEFYIKTADGRYGRLSVNWYAAQNSPTHLDWNCSINPSGSRNLER